MCVKATGQEQLKAPAGSQVWQTYLERSSRSKGPWLLLPADAHASFYINLAGTCQPHSSKAQQSGFIPASGRACVCVSVRQLPRAYRNLLLETGIFKLSSHAD